MALSISDKIDVKARNDKKGALHSDKGSTNGYLILNVHESNNKAYV